jgi:hypothetical protein
MNQLGRLRQRIRPYRKLFVIAVEGHVTEPDYFNEIIRPLLPRQLVEIQCLRSGHRSDPNSVLRRLKDHVETEPARPGKELWLVVDKDQWSPEQLDTLLLWVNESRNGEIRGLALSNPCFEYWLVLHFEEGKKLPTAQACRKRLKKYIPFEKKQLFVKGFNLQRIRQAVQRAENKLGTVGQPMEKVGTTVFRLVAKLLEYA